MFIEALSAIVKTKTKNKNLTQMPINRRMTQLWHIYTRQCHTATERTPLWDIHRDTEQKKPDTKEHQHLLSDSNNVKFKNRYNQLMMTEVRIVVSSGECGGI